MENKYAIKSHLHDGKYACKQSAQSCVCAECAET